MHRQEYRFGSHYPYQIYQLTDIEGWKPFGNETDIFKAKRPLYRDWSLSLVETSAEALSLNDKSARPTIALRTRYLQPSGRDFPVYG